MTSPSSSALSNLSLTSLPPYSTTNPARLQSLYSDIVRQKHSNPASYHANVDWWRRTLESLVSSGHTDSQNKLSLNAGKGLVEKLRFEGVGKPLGLGAVVADLRSTNSLVPLSYFLSSTQSVYASGSLPWRIASFVVGKPLWWALEQLNVVDSEDSISDVEWWKRVGGEYVLLGLVEKAADAVLAKQRTRIGLGIADSLYDLDGFQREFSQEVTPDGVLSNTDLKVLLRHLERDKKVLVVDKEVIKFITVSDSEPQQVTAVDRGILELKSAVQNLQGQVDNIQCKIDECSEKISFHLRQKQKLVALSYLRSKKQLEDLLSKRLGSLDNLRSTFIRVEAAAGDVEIMKAYESSTVTLRTILAHPSLQRDAIDDTMDAMATATADAREVDDAIRVVGGEMAAAEIEADDDELEAELRELVKEAERETEEKETRAKLEVDGIRVPSGKLGDYELTREVGRPDALSIFASLSKKPIAASTEPAES